MSLQYTLKRHFFVRPLKNKLQSMSHKKYVVLSLCFVSLLWACGSSNTRIEDFKTKETAGTSKGESLFQSKCSMCHSLNEDKIGPALAGVEKRWGGDVGKLKLFIKDAQKMINSGDAYAAPLYEKWNKSNMPSFPDLTEEELNDIIAYLK